MKYNGDAKIIKAKVSDDSSDLFTDEPVKTPWEKDAEKNAPATDENAVDYEPAPETEMDFMTEEEEKEKRKSVIIGAVIGLLIAGLLLGAYLYHNHSGKIKEADVPKTVATENASQKDGNKSSTQGTTRNYKTSQLTVHRDEKGVWRSYAGLEKTVGYTGVVGNDTGWWYVENDVINFKFNGIAENDYGSWLIENGKVNTKFTGNYVYKGKMYRIQEGMVIGSEPLTNKATTRAPTAPTTNIASIVVPVNPVNPTNSATPGSNGTTPGSNSNVPNSNSTTVHVHNWVPIYNGAAIVKESSRFCQCPECGLRFSNRALLESHAYTMSHKLSDKEEDDNYNTHSEKYEVIIGYESDPVEFVCTECHATTTDADEAGYFE